MERESRLRGLLIAQKVDIQMKNQPEVEKKLKEDLIPILRAYEDLRCLLYFNKRKKIDECWRQYKGNFCDYLETFGILAVTEKDSSTKVNAGWYSKDEVMNNIEAFLTFLTPKKANK